MRRRGTLALPPTRTHRQLAAYINAHRLYDALGQQVRAFVYPVKTNTDRTWEGSRLRWPGKGRRGLQLEIWVVGCDPMNYECRLFTHESSETYRRHEEARRWVMENLHASARARSSLTKRRRSR